MKLLTIGDRVVNMDLVTDMKLHGDGVTVYLTESGTNETVLEFRGDEAQALRRWLQANTEDVMNLPSDMLVSHGGS